MSQATAAPRYIASLSQFHKNYDAIICDVWGVLHNGVKGTVSAGLALAAARKAGMSVVLLTNAPRPAANILPQLQHFGVPMEAFDGIVSSGGVTQELMKARQGQRFYHMGPPRDAPIYSGLGMQSVPLEQADYVLCSGLFDDERETAEDYRAPCTYMLSRKLPMICANPDLIVERGHELLPCAGSIAELYQAMGGEVIWVGKPHKLVYERAMQMIAEKRGVAVDKSRVLGIGDAMRTDVAGAKGFGIDTLMVLAGIHTAELGLTPCGPDPMSVAHFFSQYSLKPDLMIDVLR